MQFGLFSWLISRVIVIVSVSRILTNRYLKLRFTTFQILQNVTKQHLTSQIITGSRPFRSIKTQIQTIWNEYLHPPPTEPWSRCRWPWSGNSPNANFYVQMKPIDSDCAKRWHNTIVQNLTSSSRLTGWCGIEGYVLKKDVTVSRLFGFTVSHTKCCESHTWRIRRNEHWISYA